MDLSLRDPQFDRPHRKFKFLLLPMEGTGHVLSLIGLGHLLYRRYHKIIFAVSPAFERYLKPYPFKVRTFNDPAFQNMADPQRRWADNTARHSVHFPNPPEAQFTMQGNFYKEFVTTVLNVNDQIGEIIKEEKPDYIFVDYYVTIPAVVTSKIPWSCVVSCNPLVAYQPYDAPPIYSGYTIETPKELCSIFKKAFNELVSQAAGPLSSFSAQRGLKLEKGKVWMQSPHVNFYVYPRAVDYLDIRKQVPENWIRIEHLIRPPPNDDFGFDINRLQEGVPTIYFTLGTMGSADSALMNRILFYLGCTPFQYIVSTGPNHDQLHLPNNAIGSQFLNQLKVLPLVDLVIFHGGNNTFVECLYFGKPMIILPLFGDQFDNAIRAVQREVGLSFMPYKLTAEILIHAIVSAIANRRLKSRLKSISDNMANSTTTQKIIDFIEMFMVTHLRNQEQSQQSG